MQNSSFPVYFGMLPLLTPNRNPTYNSHYFLDILVLTIVQNSKNKNCFFFFRLRLHLEMFGTPISMTVTLWKSRRLRGFTASRSTHHHQHLSFPTNLARFVNPSIEWRLQKMGGRTSPKDKTGCPRIAPSPRLTDIYKPLKIDLPKRKGSSSNHQFSFREAIPKNDET